jgi:ubiquinone/menaquinone biosynthesis C-methylase UbiE
MPLPTWLISQLGRPRGLFGRFLARMLNRANMAMNLHMVGALDLAPGASVLEVGFGGGVALALLLDHDATLRVTGIDLAEDMVALGRRRFAAELRTGRLQLARGVVEKLPYPDGHFDAACTANCIYFWPDLDVGLRELARVLRPGASLVVAINAPEALIAAGFAARGLHTLHADELAARLRAAGFADARARRMPDPGSHGAWLIQGHRDA